MMNVQYHGTNLSGGDTSYKNWVGSTPKENVPGGYLFVSTKDIDYVVSKGCNLFRLLFSWEAVQPTPYGIIANNANPDHKKYFDTFKARVDYITSLGKDVVIDIHGGASTGFAAYYGAKIGTNYTNIAVTTLFCDLWTQLANLFKGNPRVLFGITNEPSFMPTMVWFAAAQKVIDAIRATGAKNKIVMPGNGFSAASSWNGWLYSDTGVPVRSNGYGWLNANGIGKPLTDPANNLALQVHLYADANASGESTDVHSPTILLDRVKSVVEWGRANKVQVLVAEVGLAGGVPNAQAAWDSFVAYLNANSDVVLGYLFWSYGPPSWWGNYKFTLCPSPVGLDSAAMNMIKAALALPPPVDLATQVADLKSQLDSMTRANTAYGQQVVSLNLQAASLNATISALKVDNVTLTTNLAYANNILVQVKALVS